MESFTGKTAVITGAASGIGRAIAARCAAEGMRLVLADIEEEPLALAAEELRKNGAEVLQVQVDVSDASSVENLANAAFDRFGAVHLLFNNAGVGGGASLWDTSLDDWKWVLGVNLFGVVHGIHYFVPRMLAQGSDGCIVNTASVAGLISSAGMGVYKASKHAVVTISESLQLELAAHGSKLRAAVLCPGFVNTNILISDRNRPGGPQPPTVNAIDTAVREKIRDGIVNGIAPAAVADCVFEALCANRFYILTHPEYKAAVKLRMEDILNDRDPTDLSTLQ